MSFIKYTIINQFVLFAGVGLVGTLSHYGTLIILVQAMKVNAVLSSCAGFIAGALVNYSLNYRYTFRSTKSHREAMIKFFTIAFVGLIINTLIMYVAVEILYIHYILAQATATGLVLFWNFTGNHYWTFREGIHRPRP